MAAYHCQAMAELHLHHYVNAAITLDTLYALIPYRQTTLRQRIFLQAARAYRMAGDHEASLQRVASLIHTLQRKDSVNQEILLHALLERSHIYLALGQSLRAMHDLDHILVIDETHQVALLQRARLYLTIEQPELARQDIDTITRYYPTHKTTQQLIASLSSINHNEQSDTLP
ncbi:MAG: hypothetical protein F6K62_10055 [Sphaerospermopsis sp. SIO1G2]|nr:hypothetical protein [Sphaerospermopsis sp. SIO1G2]